MTKPITTASRPSDKPKIGLVATAYRPIIGGMEVYLSHLAKQYVKAGCDVTVVVRFVQKRPLDSKALFLSSEQIRNSEKNEIKIVIVSAPQWSRVIMPILYRMRFYSVSSGVAMSICERVYRPKLSSALDGCDVIHYSGTGQEPLGVTAAKIAEKMAVPFVVTPHTHAGKWGDGADDFKLYARADKTIALTRDERKRLVEGGLGTDAVSVVTHGADPPDCVSAERFRERFGIEGPMVLYLGRKTIDKGYQLLLDAAADVWKKCPQAKFVFAGPLGTSEKFETEALADPRVFDLNVLTDTERDDAYAASDVVCVPSKNEAFGLVYMEAWAFSKPVVGLRIPTLVEIVDGAGGGVLTERSPDAVADALVSLLTNPELRNELGQAGNRVASRRTWGEVARDTLEVYAQAKAGAA